MKFDISDEDRLLLTQYQRKIGKQSRLPTKASRKMVKSHIMNAIGLARETMRIQLEQAARPDPETE